MSKQNAAKSLDDELSQMNDLIIDAIQDIKGKNIVKLDLRHIDDTPTDFFIVCEGDSTTQVKAISNNISKRLRNEFGVRANHVEGFSNAKWILLDYFQTIIHVFYPETREYYDIEDLWSDANVTEYQNL